MRAKRQPRVTLSQEFADRLHRLATVHGQTVARFLSDVLDVAEAMSEAGRITFLFPGKPGMPVQVICLGTVLLTDPHALAQTFPYSPQALEDHSSC